MTPEGLKQARDATAKDAARYPHGKRGFAGMSAERQRELAVRGGKVAHAKGTAHEFDANEARAAGRKGGMTVSRNREHMARIGRAGGKARAARQRAQWEAAAPERDETL